MSTEKPWLLKVLNGPNAGAQILISQEITVGTALENDLILNDPHISPNHCQIKRVKEEGFEVITRDGVVFINGTRMTEKENLLRLGDVLTLGSTHLTGGPSEQLWPPVKIPEIQEIGSVSQQDAPAPKAIPLPEKTAPHKKQIFSNLSLVILIVVGVCIFMALAIFKLIAHKNLMIPQTAFQPAYFNKENQKIIQEQRVAAEAFVKKLKKKFPKNNIKAVERNGVCLLYVYVQDQIQNDSVRKIMNEMHVPIACNIINMSDIDDSGLAMMGAMNLAVSITVDENTGKVTWSGYLPNQALFDLMKQQIEKDLPAITEQEFHIVLGDDAAKQACEILRKNYFGNIVVTPERENITLTGTIGMADSIRWEKVLQEIEQSFHGNVKFVNMVTISAASIKARGFFNAPVVAISISSFPYAVLENGERIFLGARANNGYIVDSITRNGIELTNHGDKKTITLMGQSPVSETNICK